MVGSKIWILFIVTDKPKEKKKRTMVFIKKYQNKNIYNESVFELKDCLIQSIPQYTFRHSHCILYLYVIYVVFPSVNIVSQEGNNIFICENLDCNIMSQFFEHDKRLPLDMICDYGYRMVVSSFYSLCSSTFYEFWNRKVMERKHSLIYVLTISTSLLLQRPTITVCSY